MENWEIDGIGGISGLKNRKKSEKPCKEKPCKISDLGVIKEEADLTNLFSTARDSFAS